MDRLIINSLNPSSSYYKEVDRIIKDNFKEKNIINANNNNVGYCMECHECWVKTPGECVIKDYGNVIAKEIINSESIVILTETFLGGYSSITKKFIDRLKPNVIPFFNSNSGIRYKKRYDKYPNIDVIAFSTEDEKSRQSFENFVIKDSKTTLFSNETKVDFIYPKSIFFSSEFKKVLEKLQEE